MKTNSDEHQNITRKGRLTFWKVLFIALLCWMIGVLIFIAPTWYLIECTKLSRYFDLNYD